MATKLTVNAAARTATVTGTNSVTITRRLVKLEGVICNDHNVIEYTCTTATLKASYALYKAQATATAKRAAAKLADAKRPTYQIDYRDNGHWYPTGPAHPTKDLAQTYADNSWTCSNYGYQIRKVAGK